MDGGYRGIYPRKKNKKLVATKIKKKEKKEDGKDLKEISHQGEEEKGR